jgi:hypothetical protein
MELSKAIGAILVITPSIVVYNLDIFSNDIKGWVIILTLAWVAFTGYKLVTRR